ncbi:lysM domain receptor-like kinase 3 isoform X2 [Magnolia sinica]|uniref:lysM domain receptor-like kinase 3 isoform X2 n=1 Tax=Magnolia sinica TaxID=86752 RepID=UPI002658AD3E|nr:lysM domain receptor-like kinase 3 isoform X2 [Magnolia sinica]
MRLLQISLCILLSFLSFDTSLSSPTPLNCSDTTRLCTSFLAYNPSPHQPISEIQSMFDVLPEDITVEDGDDRGYLFIKKNCSCAQQAKKYLTNTTFTVKEEEGYVYRMVTEAYGGLTVLVNSSRTARAGAVISLHLLCGCSSRLWNYLLSYVMQDGDTIESLASRFGVSMDSIEAANGISDPDTVSVGDVYYIPLNSVPGVPYSVKKGISPAPAPATSIYNFSVNQNHHSAHFPYGWILGSLGVGLVLILVALLVCISCKSLMCCTQESREKDPDRTSSHKFRILRRTSFCNGSGRYLCCKSVDWKPTTVDTGNHQMSIPKAMMTDVLDMEKPVVFTYEEILSSTDGFSDSNLIGHGRYGSVCFAVLRDQEVAIKRMTATKTKEFMAEMKILCKVHHTNLVELIGYAASDDELFLVYEYAHKGSLRSHLHDPQSKGHTSLSWIARVQIALDAARGLEYIHEHTKAHYVHRDIKTSNILLDTALRAKISDFGLAKLVGRTSDGEASTTRVVGTFGYLAPEYLSDGLATTKSDVYAFGVVLFELISGKEAITRTEGKVLVNPERRSLASVMAILAKQCVEEDPILRPDMKQVVISLSQILLSSVEWEATLAGNSQVFSGLVQGR